MLPSSGTGAFDLGVIGEVIRHNGQTFLTLASLLQALQTDTETSVIDTPKILTQDGRTSSIFVGRNIPFVGSFVSNTTSSTINSTNIEYRDIGLNLTITPVLGNSDIVTLDINLDRSQTLTDITQTSFTSGTTANGIVTSKTTMQTTVHVPDGNFLILSGAVLNSTAKVKTGFPCLGGLPLVGALFSSSNDLVSNTNIVIFLRPHIINSIEDMRTVTHNEEEFFRDNAGTPFLERNFDNGMEMIKTADDE
jgi:type III secretion protein C